MHGWRRSRKRLLLAVMLLPAPLIVAFGVVVALAFEDSAAEDHLGLAFGLWVAAFAAAWGSALACVVDATRGRVDSRQRGPWITALLLGATVVGPAYWWLHVRPGPGEPHGLETLTPARAWSHVLKMATGIGAALLGLFTVAWALLIGAVTLDVNVGAAVLPIVASFGVWTIVGCAVLTLFVLDALREGGSHATLWTLLLVLAWPVAAPLYWLLCVRPTAPPGGGP